MPERQTGLKTFRSTRSSVTSDDNKDHKVNIRTKFQQGNVMEGEVKTFMDNDLADPYLPPRAIKR